MTVERWQRLRRRLADSEWQEKFVFLNGAEFIFYYLENVLLKFKYGRALFEELTSCQIPHHDSYKQGRRRTLLDYFVHRKDEIEGIQYFLSFS